VLLLKTNEVFESKPFSQTFATFITNLRQVKNVLAAFPLMDAVPPQGVRVQQ
jgi:hypothetical protein